MVTGFIARYLITKASNSQISGCVPESQRYNPTIACEQYGKISLHEDHSLCLLPNGGNDAFWTGERPGSSASSNNHSVESAHRSGWRARNATRGFGNRGCRGGQDSGER